MNTKQIISTAVLPLTAAILLTGCSEHATNTHDDHDVITTVKILLTEHNTLIQRTFVWEDLDGPGGNAPNRIDTLHLKPGTVHDFSIELSNKSVMPIRELTTEIKDEADHHQFFYYVTPEGLVTINIVDIDSHGKPLGLRGELTNISDRGVGTLRVDLSHWEKATDKTGLDPGQDTDISVTFPVVVD